jgi:hypothetical protein
MAENGKPGGRVVRGMLRLLGLLVGAALFFGAGYLGSCLAIMRRFA